MNVRLEAACSPAVLSNAGGSGAGLLADTAYVRVFISDVNDNKPVFAQRLYEVGVDENADVGLAIVTVSANDEDDGESARER